MLANSALGFVTDISMALKNILILESPYWVIVCCESGAVNVLNDKYTMYATPKN
jgi:hypothetical protein